MTRTDEQLVVAYLAGQQDALEILFGRYMKTVYGFVYRLMGDTHAAEDVTQDAFVKAWKHLQRFDTNRKFKTWILQIAKNTAFDYLKKKRAVPFSELDDLESDGAFVDTIVDPAPIPSALLERADIVQTLTHVLEQLSPVSRAIMQLRYHDDMTFQEIAESIGEPMNTVKSRHQRALFMLRRLLSEPK